METEAAAQESLGLGKLGTQAEKDRRLKKKWVLFLCDFLAETWSKYQDFYCFTQMWNERQDYGILAVTFLSSIKLFKAAYKI